MRDLMIDIETFGTGPDAAIASIGAVFFDPVSGTMAETPEDGQFHARIDLGRSASPGNIDAGTVEFWLKQSDEARGKLIDPNERLTLEAALQGFASFVYAEAKGNHGGGGIVKGGKLWSNGPMFDERIMREAFRRHGWLFPFHFRASRCCRTIYALASAAGWDPDSNQRDVTHHDALDDSIFQAQGVISMYQHMGLSSNLNLVEIAEQKVELIEGPVEVTEEEA